PFILWERRTSGSTGDRWSSSLKRCSTPFTGESFEKSLLRCPRLGRRLSLKGPLVQTAPQPANTGTAAARRPDRMPLGHRPTPRRESSSLCTSGGPPPGTWELTWVRESGLRVACRPPAARHARRAPPFRRRAANIRKEESNGSASALLDASARSPCRTPTARPNSRTHSGLSPGPDRAIIRPGRRTHARAGTFPDSGPATELGWRNKHCPRDWFPRSPPCVGTHTLASSPILTIG